MVLLEIEQKFAFLPSLLHTFRRNRGNPPFSKLKSLGTICFHDTYFEQSGSQILTKNGIWIRKRDGIWEAKKRPTARESGDGASRDHHTQGKLQPHEENEGSKQKGETGTKREFIRTAFEEIRCRQRIHSLVLTHIPNSPDWKRDFGLDIFCQFGTRRETFLVDDKFSVMLDETSFGHSTGEVEVEVEVEVEAADGKAEGKQDVTIERAHRDIDNFMLKYSWFFGRGGKEEPKGKLMAYFEAFPPTWER